MQISRLNDWLQILASLGVILGLLLVAYELRESNRFATSEAVKGIEDCFNDAAISEIETDIAELIVKSVQEPENLSSAEELKLNGWLNLSLNCYSRWLNMYQLGVARYDPIPALQEVTDYYFGSAFGRAWFEANKDGWYDEISEAIEAELDRIPVRTEPPEIARYE